MVFRAARRGMQSPALFRLGARLGRVLQRPFLRAGRLRRLPLFFGKWTATRDLPPVAARTFSERWRELEKP
jgi:L-lactate dehydrogenase complex protein LldF